MSPARTSAIVSIAPARNGGRKLRLKRRPGPEKIGSFAARAFRTIDHPPSTTASRHSTAQVAVQAKRVGCRAATSAATAAVHPIATCPHPGTAVNDPARSIVARM